MAKPQITWERAPGRKWVVTVRRPEEQVRMAFRLRYPLWPLFGTLAPRLYPLSRLLAPIGL